MRKPKQPTRKERREQIRSRLLIAPELSNRAVAKYFNCSHHTVSKIREEMIENGQIAHLETHGYDWLKHPYLIAHPELLENASERILRALKADGVLDIMEERQSISAAYCQRLLRHRRKAERSAELVKVSSDSVKLIHTDLTKGLSDIESKSIDLLLCDPPYSREFLPLLSSISALAARVLRDDGNLLVLYGNRHLPEALNRLNEHMTFWWELAYMTPASGSPSLPWLGISTFWKLLLWYRKPKQPYKGTMIYDIVNTGKPDKDREKLHIWQQDVAGMEAVIERFTELTMTVLYIKRKFIMISFTATILFLAIYYVWTFFSFNSRIAVGQLNTDIIVKIELLSQDEQIEITDADEIKAILYVS